MTTIPDVVKKAIDDPQLLALLENAYAEQEKLMLEQVSRATASSDITLTLTCFACPESYLAFVATEAHIAELQVGYLRLRHGRFTVECPDSGGQRVFESETEGDGLFDDSEREKFLTMAIEAIRLWHEGFVGCKNTSK